MSCSLRVPGAPRGRIRSPGRGPRTSTLPVEAAGVDERLPRDVGSAEPVDRRRAYPRVAPQRHGRGRSATPVRERARARGRPCTSDSSSYRLHALQPPPSARSAEPGTCSSDSTARTEAREAAGLARPSNQRCSSRRRKRWLQMQQARRAQDRIPPSRTRDPAPRTRAAPQHHPALRLGQQALRQSLHLGGHLRRRGRRPRPPRAEPLPRRGAPARARPVRAYPG